MKSESQIASDALMAAINLIVAGYFSQQGEKRDRQHVVAEIASVLISEAHTALAMVYDEPSAAFIRLLKACGADLDAYEKAAD